MRTISINNIELDNTGDGLPSMHLSDAFTEFLQVPVTKLDADQYSAEDLDGVTESLFGSGNLNFLMMQSGQTDGAMALNNPYMFQGGSGNNGIANSGQSFSLRAGTPGGGGNAERSEQGNGGGRIGDGGHDHDGGASGNFTSSTINSVGAGGLVAKNGGGSLLSKSSFSHDTGGNGDSGHDGSDGGGNGTDGTNGSDGHGGGDTIVNNYHETTVVDLSQVNEFVENVFTEINHLTQIIEGDVLTDIVTNTINTTITNLQTNITNILNIIPGLGDGDGTPGPADHDVGIGGLELNLDPVEDLVGDLDVSATIGNLLGHGETSNALGDHDITIGGNIQLLGSSLAVPQLHIGLDIVETLVGDIDIDLSAAGNVLGAIAPGLIDGYAGGTGIPTVQSVTMGALAPVVADLLGTGTNDGGTDSDVTVGTNISLAGLQPVVDNLLGQTGLGGISVGQIGDSLSIGSITDGVSVGEITNSVGLGDHLSVDDVTQGLGLGDLTNNGWVDQFLDNTNLDDVTLGNVTDILQTVSVDGITDSLGLGNLNLDPIINGGSVDAITTGLGLGDLGIDEGLQQLGLNGVTDVVNQIIDGTGLADIGVGTITDIVHDIGDLNLADIGTGDLSGLTDLTVSDLTHLTVGDVGNALGISDITDGISLGDLTGIQDLNTNLDLGNAADAVDQLVDHVGLGDALTPVTDIVHDVLGGNLADISTPDLSGVGLGNLDLGHLPLDSSLVEGVQQVALDPVEDLVGDIDVDANLGLLGAGETSNAAGDTDIHLPIELDLGGHHIVDIPLDISLDPIEALTGDIDLGGGIALDLLGNHADSIINSGTGGTGDATPISNLGNTLGSVAGDIASVVHAELGGSIPTIDLGAIVNSVTNMDSGITAAVNLLPANDHAASTSTGSTGVLGSVIGWTENLIPDAGHLLGGGTTTPAASVLPDPVGHIAEGLGGLLDSGSHSGGGLLGGNSHHHGGLFG